MQFNNSKSPQRIYNTNYCLKYGMIRPSFVVVLSRSYYLEYPKVGVLRLPSCQLWIKYSTSNAVPNPDSPRGQIHLILDRIRYGGS